MPLTVECPACRTVVLFPDSAAGKSAKCGCGQVITIPKLITDPPSQTPATITPISNSAADDNVNERARALREQRANEEAQFEMLKTRVFNGLMFLPRKVIALCVKEKTDAPTISMTGHSSAAHIDIDSAPKKGSMRGDRAGTIFDVLLGGITFLSKVVVVVIVAGAIVGVVYHFHEDAKSQHAQPIFPPQHASTSSTIVDVGEKRKLRQATGDLIHQFERTDGARWLTKNDIRSIIFVIVRMVPPERQDEAFNDLINASQIAPNVWLLMKEQNKKNENEYVDSKQPLMIPGWTEKNVDYVAGSFGRSDETKYLTKGVKDTLDQFIHNYFAIAEDCWKRGTTVDAEAIKELGE